MQVATRFERRQNNAENDNVVLYKVQMYRGESDVGFPIFADTNADFEFNIRGYYIFYYSRVMKMSFGHR